MSDYNRKIAEALGWRFHVCVWFDTDGNEHLNLNFETDWTQLPAILAGISKHGTWQAIGDSNESIVNVGTIGGPDYIGEQGANLLLAAGALLLKLAEQRGKP